MANILSRLIKQRSQTRVESNLETGRIWSYTPGNEFSNFCTGFCWVSPGTGTAVIELWGAGGSGARMCCCGGGLPGNPGGYSKKTIQVESGDRVCGTVGWSCGNADALCFRGCSTNSGLCWVTASSGDGCMCSQGGTGGSSFCTTGASLYCCFRANGYCVTGPYNANCGVVCNYGTSRPTVACGYGGDVNCCGGFSCTLFFGCQAPCNCCYHYHTKTPPGFISTQGGEYGHNSAGENRQGQHSGVNLNNGLYALSAHTRNPSRGMPQSYCWRSDRSCGCYEMQGCIQYVPPGFGGYAPSPCPGVRDHGGRGGNGAVRIRYYE